jgi:hypothetical protein
MSQGDDDEPGDRRALLGARRGFGQVEHLQPRGGERAPHGVRAMGIPQRRTEPNARPCVGLDGECKKAATRQHAGRSLDDRLEVCDIDENVGRDDQVAGGVALAG